MHIAILGYMGSGKSTVAPMLASKTGGLAVDLDSHIEEQTGATVAELIRIQGELAFRKAERNALLSVFESTLSLVLATGGGTPCYYNNMEVLLEKSFTAYLRRSPKSLYEQLVESRGNRPVLDGVDKANLHEYIAKHLFDRRPYYEQAECIVDCDGRTPESIVQEIIETWKKTTPH